MYIILKKADVFLEASKHECIALEEDNIAFSTFERGREEKRRGMTRGETIHNVAKNQVRAAFAGRRLARRSMWASKLSA